MINFQQQAPHPTGTAATTSEEKVRLRQMLRELTPQELEIAARASHEYLMDPNPATGKTSTKHFAKLYAQRFLRAKGGNADKALERMKQTIQFRSDIDIDGLRRAFDENKDQKNVDYAKQLEAQMQSKSVYVQGFDKEGRSTYIFVPRNAAPQGGKHNAEWTLKQHVYNLERAVACSRAADKTINVVVDLKGFSLDKTAHDIVKQLLTIFRSNYVGTIHQIFLVDAPFSFHCLWNVFKPLLLGNSSSSNNNNNNSKARAQRIHFVKSNHKQSELAKCYDVQQASPWMMRGGKRTRELDIHEYLYKTPFHCSFDG